MTAKSQDFHKKYGPWALIAGASEGLGAEFARTIASRGLDILLIARRQEKLDSLCNELSTSYGVQVEPLALDLATADLEAKIRAKVDDKEVGLLVYNAGLSTIGPFMEQQLDTLLEAIEVNCRGPLTLAHTLGRPMLERGRGGIVLMTSLSGFQGTALVATYAATKAFNLVLAEALWDELREGGVDVLACAAGATSTPNFIASAPSRASRLTPPALTPKQVAVETIDALEAGRGPTVVPGLAYRLSSVFIQRLLPRALAVRFLGANLRSMYQRSR